MNYLISQNVPICPECQGFMMKRHSVDVYYCCVDCKKILRVIGTGTAEIELIVTDGADNEKRV